MVHSERKYSFFARGHPIFGGGAVYVLCCRCAVAPLLELKNSRSPPPATLRSERSFRPTLLHQIAPQHQLAVLHRTCTALRARFSNRSSSHIIANLFPEVARLATGATGVTVVIQSITVSFSDTCIFLL